MRKQLVEIALDAELEAFLTRFRADRRPEAVSLLVNSLLRHERFREGLTCPPPAERISSHPAATPIETEMLQQSGLLPPSVANPFLEFGSWLQSLFYLLK